MAGYAGAWHGHGSFHDREPASFGGARLGGGVLVGLDGAHAHGALGTLCNAQIGLFSHVRVYYGAGFIRRIVD